MHKPYLISICILFCNSLSKHSFNKHKLNGGTAVLGLFRILEYYNSYNNSPEHFENFNVSYFSYSVILYQVEHAHMHFLKEKKKKKIHSVMLIILT